MREIAQHAAACPFDRFEAFGQLVDGGREYREVGSESRTGRTPAIFASGDPGSRFGNRVDRALHSSGEEPGDGQSNSHGDQQSNDEGDNHCGREGLFDMRGLGGGVGDAGLCEVVGEDAGTDSGCDDP
mgnify:CR=1 FL=1